MISVSCDLSFFVFCDDFVFVAVIFLGLGRSGPGFWA